MLGLEFRGPTVVRRRRHRPGTDATATAPDGRPVPPGPGPTGSHDLASDRVGQNQHHLNTDTFTITLESSPLPTGSTSSVLGPLDPSPPQQHTSPPQPQLQAAWVAGGSTGLALTAAPFKPAVQIVAESAPTGASV